MQKYDILNANVNVDVDDKNNVNASEHGLSAAPGEVRCMTATLTLQRS